MIRFRGGRTLLETMSHNENRKSGQALKWFVSAACSSRQTVKFCVRVAGWKTTDKRRQQELMRLSPLLKCRNGDALDMDRWVRAIQLQHRWVKNWRFLFFFLMRRLFGSVSESQVSGVAAWPFQFQHCTQHEDDENNAQYNKILNPKTKAGTHTNLVVDSSVNSQKDEGLNALE